MKCKNCKSEVKGSGNVYCSDDCKEIAANAKKEARIAKKAENLSGIEGVDYIVCNWCQMKVKRVYGIHIKNHHKEKTIEDYKKEFPKAVLTCSKDKESTSKHSGLHMKQDFYRQLAKENVSGEKNPNHKSKTTLEERQRRSPFSQLFTLYENQENKQQAVSEFVKSALSDRLTETQLEYWIEKFDGDEESAKKVYRERQSTFSLEKCVAKYGEEVGFEIWRERNVKWSAKVEAKYKNGEFTKFCKHNYSNTELEFFKKLVEEFKPQEKFYCALPGNRQFFRYFKEEQITKSFDFVYENKIIEFNGDYWHCNPSKYKEDYFNSLLNCTAKEKWESDKQKLDLIKKCGYKVLIIWEEEYKKSPETIIKKCINFLNERDS